MPALTESDFKATMQDPMVEVTSAPGDVVDIWPMSEASPQKFGCPRGTLALPAALHAFANACALNGVT